MTKFINMHVISNTIEMTIGDSMSNEKKIIIVSCSGASNTGSTSDGVARLLCTRDPERYDMLCLPAYALGKAPSIKKLNEAKKIVVIEGCPSRCASDHLKQGGITPDQVVEVVQDYGIKKVMIPECDAKDIDRIVADIEERLREA